MMQRMLSRDTLVRAIRIVLVFTLVFWSSFRVECLAFADVFHDSASDHEGEVVSNLEVWQVTNSDEGGESVLKVKARDALDTAQGKDQSEALRVAADGGTMQFVAVPYWKHAAVEQTYTVTYVDGLDGSTIATYEELKEGDPTPAPETVPEHEGYTFTGWSPAPAAGPLLTRAAAWEISPAGN